MNKVLKDKLNKALGELLVLEITDAIEKASKGQKRADALTKLSEAISEATKDGE
jgi:hypothetical protein